MTLRHMKIFVAVYQQKSITLASNSLHLAQPSVSLAIRELEEYYHIRLFDRLSRRIYPTENGHRFYEYALHIVSLFSEMENKIPAWDANAPLHIGSSITLGTCLIPSLVKAYQEQHPEIKIYVTVKNTGTIEQAVVDNQLDFALVEGYFDRSRYSARLYRQEAFFGICAPGHRLAGRTVPLEELERERLILREPGSGTRAILEEGLRRQNRALGSFPGVVAISDFPVTKTLVARGLGVSFLYAPVAESGLAAGTLARFELAQVPMSGAFYLVCLKDNLFAGDWLHWLE